MNWLVFTHANLQRPLYINEEAFEAFHWNEATKSVVVYTSKFGVFPVSESIEQVLKITGASAKGDKSEPAR